MNSVLLPMRYRLPSGEEIIERLLLVDSAAIYTLDNKKNIIVVTQDLCGFWVKNDYLPRSLFSSINLGSEEFYYFEIEDCFSVSSFDIGLGLVDFSQALSFTHAYLNSKEKPGSTKNSLYVEKYSVLLPLDLGNDLDNELSYKLWLTNGVNLKDSSFKAVSKLTPLNDAELEECFELAGVSYVLEPSDPTVNKYLCEFELFGRESLEEFVNDYIIDVINNRDSYRKMGIEGPSSFILYGPPGCGKTYAAEKIVNHLGWPVFKVDSASVASPYIHETSKKISEVFDEAIRCAPSVILIDEMESYTSNRSTAKDHKLEEVNEFLRRIPEAINAGVLIIGMTNFIEDIDPALKRKGRFNHLIEIGIPNESEIRASLNFLTQRLPLESDTIKDEVIDSLIGRTLADIDFVVKEAARKAAKDRVGTLSHNELMSAIELLPMLPSIKKNKIGFL
ncbi:AAA family ATPase [Vibrio vulnificus]|nr:AAA family ATPase [Vibrio parahaemolyticus]ELP6737979.1 AAA family ATPase [Vibrio vulnificus]